MVTGGCGFVGSSLVSELCDRMPHADDRDINEREPRVGEVFVYDDLSSCWMNEDDGITPKFLDPRAALVDWMEDEPIAAAGEIDTLVHLAMRWPLEREKAVFEKTFEDFVVQGLNLALGFSHLKRLSRVIVGSTVEEKGPAAALCASLRAALGYWHRPPTLGVYFVHLPELEGERRLPESYFPDPEQRAYEVRPVADAVKLIADLADGTSRHRKLVDVYMEKTDG
jgi:nucleoside-diphosphate-sugar epimerase